MSCTRATGSPTPRSDWPGVGRFRVNLHRERGRPAATIRALPRTVPRLSTLSLPPQVEQLAHLTRGLILVGGGTGSGKSTTLAALVDEINRREARHIITIEDPIEYEHVHRRSIVEQVEIGVDAPDYPTALRAALRQMPDVLIVGEMRDPESMRLALTAAETGHLVISTVHTTDVTSTVGRMADSFPVERQATIRQEISLALSAVLIQSLLPRTAGGLVPAVELLMVQYGARQHIRKNQLHHLHQEITLTRRFGSLTFEESLAVARARRAHRRGHGPRTRRASGRTGQVDRRLSQGMQDSAHRNEGQSPKCRTLHGNAGLLAVMTDASAEAWHAVPARRPASCISLNVLHFGRRPAFR